jgi:hypothetical protein
MSAVIDVYNRNILGWAIGFSILVLNIGGWKSQREQIAMPAT